jgi:hypothetical protein
VCSPLEIIVNIFGDDIMFKRIAEAFEELLQFIGREQVPSVQSASRSFSLSGSKPS